MLSLPGLAITTQQLLQLRPRQFGEFPLQHGQAWGWMAHPSGGILIWLTVSDSRTTGQTTIALHDWESGKRKAHQKIQERGWDYAGRSFVAAHLRPDGKMLLMRNQQWLMHCLNPTTLGPSGSSFSVPGLDYWSFSPDCSRLLNIANESRVWNLQRANPSMNHSA